MVHPINYNRGCHANFCCRRGGEEETNSTGFRDRTQPLESRESIGLQAVCMTLIDLSGPKLNRTIRRTNSLPGQLQMFVALNFFATGAVLDDTATTHGVDRNTAPYTIHRVAEVLCDMGETVSKIQTFLLSFMDSVLFFYRSFEHPTFVTRFFVVFVNSH